MNWIQYQQKATAVSKWLQNDRQLTTRTGQFSKDAI